MAKKNPRGYGSNDMVCIQVTSQDSNQDRFLPRDMADELYEHGELDWCLTNEQYCLPSRFYGTGLQAGLLLDLSDAHRWLRQQGACGEYNALIKK